MEKQPEALRLADALDQVVTPYTLESKAAAELRRLHAENERLKQEAALQKMADNARELGLDYEPVAHLWQHGETGRTRIVTPDMIITADANWVVVGPLYLAPPQRQRQPEQEPVGWITQAGFELARTTLFGGECVAWRIPVYAALPQRQPLLFSQRKAIADKLELGLTAEFNAVVSEVERAHGIGNKHD